jgi:hypothetical protein
MNIFTCSPPLDCLTLGCTILPPCCNYLPQNNSKPSPPISTQTNIIHFTVNELSPTLQDQISALFVNYTNYFVNDPTVLNSVPYNFITLQNRLIAQGTISNTIVANYTGSTATSNLLGYVDYKIIKFISSYATAGFFKTFLNFAYGISQDGHSIDSLSQIMLTFSSNSSPSTIGTFPSTTPYATSYNGLLLTYSLPPVSNTQIPITLIPAAISKAGPGSFSLIGAFPSRLSAQLNNLNEYCIGSESVLENFALKSNYILYYNYNPGNGDQYMTIRNSDSSISFLTLPTTLNAVGFSYDTTQTSGAIDCGTGEQIYYNRALNIYRYIEKFNL